MRARSVTALLVTLGLLAGAQAALAGTVSVDGRSLLFTAAPGEVNDAIIDNYHRPTALVDFGAPLVAGPGCRQATPIECDLWSDETAYLGDRDDKARLNSYLDSSVYGEAGNDTIASDGEIGWAYGGTGADTIRATGNGAGAYGGPGPDHIEGGGTESGFMKGEEGKDVLTQTRITRSCRSDLDGGPGADRLVGYACTLLIGGPGSDALTVYLSGEGADRAGRFDGGPGGDYIVGGLGPDKIDAGPGPDFIQAAADRVGDTVVCGTGQDTVRADPLDIVATDCEHVTIVGA
jgi:Ca2+-binding RTX toxin-like protein